MRTYYLDSNAIFKLSRNHQLSARALQLQRNRCCRFAVGHRVVWEMAGVLEHKPGDAERITREANLAASILDGGGLLARDGVILAIDALSVSPRDRHPYRIPAIYEKGSEKFLDGYGQLRSMAAGENRDRTLAWYHRIRRFFDPKAFLASERVYEDAIRGGRARQQATTADLMHDLNMLQAVGKLREITEATARRLAEQHKRTFKGYKRMPRNAPLAWFGPLGVIVRCQLAFTMLHVLKHDSLGKQKPKSGDLPDISHVTVAGMIGSFVTDDRAAKEVFGLTWPSRSRTCPAFEAEFLPYMERETARTETHR